jgi:hypothetical protein
MRTTDGRGGPGYEVRDVNARRVAILTAVLALIIVAAMALMVALFDGLAARATRGQQPPVSLAGAGDALPPEPRLQAFPARDLAAMRAAEQQLLDGYAWVDREAGIVSIPIEEAMERVVARGLPARDGEASRP